MDERKSVLSRVLTWLIIGVVAIIAFKVAIRLLAFLLSMLGMVFGIVVFLLFTVAPILLLGWLAVAGWKAFTRDAAA